MRRPTAVRRSTRLGNFSVLSDRSVRTYVLRYAAHCWELFGSRSWMVAFLTFAQSIVPAPLSPAAIHAVANLGSPIASIVGNEAALRVGRARVIAAGMMLSGALTYLQRAWWVVTLPGLAILITVLAFNLMGDGLRDALDPKLKR